MAKTLSLDAPFRKGERVIATMSLPGVPEGTTGKVKLVNGLKWTRYWVFFDNGVDLGSIDQHKLVRAKQWEQYQVRREQALNAPAAASATSGATAAAAGDGAAAPGAAAGSRVPEHLIERTKRRREQLGLS